MLLKPYNNFRTREKLHKGKLILLRLCKHFRGKVVKLWNVLKMFH